MIAAAEPQVWTVWLDQVQKIASFHAVDGYEFRDHSHFLHYMEDLQNSGYLFQ